MPDDETPKLRGLAAMSPERRREIASKGGKATQAKGTGNRFTPESAREAGVKGGKSAQASGKAHRFTTETAREAGIKGGRPSHKPVGET
jgi:general stress protein YciG